MSHPIEGKFECALFSPKGGIEGALITVNSDVVQLTIDKDAEQLSNLVAHLDAGQMLVVDATSSTQSHKGEAAHSVFMLRQVLKIDGIAIEKEAQAMTRKFCGKVDRLNYARHGEANGIVLETGDFIHLKPEGFKAAHLSVGDVVEARGRAKRLVTGTGFVVEAHEINGKVISAKPNKKPAH